MFTCVTCIVLAVILLLLLTPSSLYPEYFSNGLPECNKLMANSPHTENVACQFVWKKPVFLPKGATVPTVSSLRFSDTTGVSGAIHGSKNAVLAECKTNTNITERINDSLLNDVRSTIQKDESTKELITLIRDIWFSSYLGAMEDTFQNDVMEDEIVKSHFNKYAS